MAIGQENGPRREHDGGMQERHGGDGDTSSVPGAKYRLWVDATAADTPGSARRCVQCALCFTSFSLESFIWENTTRAAHAVAPNLPPPPEERRPVRGIKPLERSKNHRRRRGTPPRRDVGCESQWRFPRFRACARPGILGGDGVWRIDCLLTHILYRNGCIGDPRS